MDHVRNNHLNNSLRKTKSQFLSSKILNTVVGETIKFGVQSVQENGRIRHYYKFGHAIGEDIVGKKMCGCVVIMDHGHIITAYPSN